MKSWKQYTSISESFEAVRNQSQNLNEDTPFQTAFSSFLVRWNKMVKEYYKTNFPTLIPPQLSIETGRKFIRIIRIESGHRASCMGFVALVDGEVDGVAVKQGDILKCASYAKPAKHTRGSIFAPDGGMSAVTPYGIVRK